MEFSLFLSLVFIMMESHHHQSYKESSMPLPIYQNNIPAHPLAAIQSIIAVAAGKGGVGKSSVTVNLALALKAKGYKVGVMDADVYGPSIRRMLPEDRLPVQKGELITPALSSGIEMLSMAYFRKEKEAMVVRAPIANGVIGQFIKNVRWGPLDFLLIDFPPGTGDIQLTLSQQANLTGALMVTTPQEVALMDVRKAINMFEQVKVPIIGIVENMSYYESPHSPEPVYIFGRGGGGRLADETGVPFLGQIPLDPELCRAGDEGRSVFAMNRSGAKGVTQAFMALAERLVSHVELLKQENASCLQNFELNWKEMGAG
jgi:ATP-binding protein involved in chromosome partitioning